jgi:hypothetical protein
MLRLPGSVAPYFEERLRATLPTKAERGSSPESAKHAIGKLNSSVFGERMRGKGQYWEATCTSLQNSTPSRLGFHTREEITWNLPTPYLPSSNARQQNLFG